MGLSLLLLLSSSGDPESRDLLEASLDTGVSALVHLFREAFSKHSIHSGLWTTVYFLLNFAHDSPLWLLFVYYLPHEKCELKGSWNPLPHSLVPPQWLESCSMRVNEKPTHAPETNHPPGLTTHPTITSRSTNDAYGTIHHWEDIKTRLWDSRK